MEIAHAATCRFSVRRKQWFAGRHPGRWRGCQRLRPGGYLKPLTPLLGVTLLERVVLACRDVGVSECIVVLGYGKERIGERLDELADRAGIAVRGVENPHWEEGNGTSALAAQPYIRGPFLLAMCDHVFDPAILRRLVDAGGEGAECLLAVDYRRPNRCFASTTPPRFNSPRHNHRYRQGPPILYGG